MGHRQTAIRRDPNMGEVPNSATVLGPSIRLGRAAFHQIAPIRGKGQSLARRLGHRFAQGPDAIEGIRTGSGHLRLFRRAESPCRERREVSGAMPLDIDPKRSCRRHRNGH